MGRFLVHALDAGSYSKTSAFGFQPGASPAKT